MTIPTPAPSTDTVHYLLIGGSGFLGTGFAARLTSESCTVTHIARGQISGASLIGKAQEALIPTLAADTRHIIVDFAYTSVPNTSFSDPIEDFSSNLHNVIDHLEFTRKVPNSTYVYISSGGAVYGNVSEKKPITEDTANLPLSPYGVTKLACEKYVYMHKAVHGIDVRIVRPANVYGPGQRPFRGQGLIATAIARVLQGDRISIFGDGSHVRDYLYIEDFCSVLLDIITKGENGAVYNVASGVGSSINDILHKLSDQLPECPIKTDYLPGRPFDVSYNVLDCAKVRALNGWTPTVDLDPGLVRTIEWLRPTLHGLR